MDGHEPERGRPAGVPPAPRTSLVGRDTAVAEVVAALEGSRLLTLTGPGGAGKTRLALAALDVVRRTGDRPGRQVRWTELGGVHAAALVAETVARTLGAPANAGSTPVDAIVDHLGQAEAVLAIDNCEHIVDACAALADELLDSCPGLRLLATSREPLGVAGEMVWPVPALSLPEVAGATAETVAASAAGQLFEQRARAIVPGFRLDAANADATARLCRRLDGLPLAIELAAARMRVLTVDQIVAGLDDACRLLVGGARTAPARQQTLRAALDWSHDLLTEPERVVFRRLAVFAGSFDLAAAEHVAAGGPIAAADVLDILSHLADRSLVSVQWATPSARYRMLATVREYGRERLAAAGGATSVRRAHLEHYCELAERVEPLLSGPDQVRELDRLETDGNNLRIALAFARAHGETRLGVRLAAALWRLCYLRGHYREGREWLDWAATADPEAPTGLRAKALRGGGSLAFLQCDYAAAVRRLEASLQLYRDLDDDAGVASVLQVLGSVAREQGRFQRAEALHRESLELFEAAGDSCGVAQAHGYLGFAAWLQQHWAEAAESCGRALREFRALGDAEGIAWSLISLGTVAQYQGEHDRADALLTEAQALAERASYPEGVAWARHELGLLTLRRGPGRTGRAEELLLDSLARHRELGDRWRTASVLADLASAALVADRPQRAGGLLGAAAAIREDIGTVVAPCERADNDAVEERARELLGPDAFSAEWSRGRESTIDDVLAAEGQVLPSSPEPAPDATGSGRERPAEGVPLRIRMLGAAEVHLGDRQLHAADFGYGKPRELLWLLASTPRQTKEQIGLALWPDLAGGQLRNAFHTALRDLRRALGDPGWVVFNAGGYALDRSRDQWSDLHEFEASLAAARRARPAPDALPHLQRAIAAYGGDFLPEVVDLDWVDTRRGQLRRVYSAALGAAGRLLAASGRYAEAAEVYRTATEHDPLEESSHRHLMSCLVRMGEPARAARLYQDLCTRLRDELGIAPSAETTAVYDRLARRS